MCRGDRPHYLELHGLFEGRGRGQSLRSPILACVKGNPTELVINLKTAKAFGLTIPLPVHVDPIRGLLTPVLI